MGSSFKIDKRLAALKSAVGVVEIWREGRQSGALESGEAKSFGRNSMNPIWLLLGHSASSHKSLFWDPEAAHRFALRGL
jgi:hypothetical protein